MCYSNCMTDFSSESERQEALYKEIFTEAAKIIRHEIDKIKPKDECKFCTIPCDIEKPDVFSVFPWFSSVTS